MKIIEFDHIHRKKHFEFFRKMNHPHFSITANVDISAFLKRLKSNAWPFMPSIAWLVSHTANAIPVFRQRIRGEQIVEHAFVHPSFAVDTDVADVFSFCEVKYQPNLQAFLTEAEQVIAQMKSNPSFEDEEGRDDYLFLSSIPWISFTGITHAMHYHPHDSVPRITWGKYIEQGDKKMLPLSVQVHHALVDGKYVGQFFKIFEELSQEP